MNSKKMWLQKRKKDGKCLQCGKPSGPKSKVYCNKCSMIFANNSKKRVEKLLKEGLCSQCTKPSERRACRDCLNKNNIKKKEKVKIRQADGICIRCGKTQSVLNNRKCTICCLKHSAWTYFRDGDRWIDLQELFNKQNGLCPYTGRQLIIGLDAEIDHIVSRHQGGNDELTNFQWVHRDINKMKAHQSHEQFIHLIQEVAQYCL
jgi:hypothetical protein